MVLNCNRCGRSAPEELRSAVAGSACPRKVHKKYSSDTVPCVGKFIEQEFPQCLETVHEPGRAISWHLCGKAARFARVTESDTYDFHGHLPPGTVVHYCGTHDPVSKEERRKKRGPPQFELDCARRRAAAERVERMENALKLLCGPRFCNCGKRAEALHEPGCVIRIATETLGTTA